MNVINYHFIDYIIKCYVTSNTFDQPIKLHFFKQAMLHVSTKTDKNYQSYERLEYLGDAVFHFIITEYLYKRYEDEAEGFLTKLRIKLEKGDSMAQLAKTIGLNAFVQLKGIPMNDHILEDVFESFTGAFYLHFGITHTRTFIISLIEKHKDLSEIILKEDNYKDLLLRYFHQKGWNHPMYEEVVSKHSRYTHCSVVKKHDNVKIGKGLATSKKKAEQLASKGALIHLGVIIDNEIDPDWMSKIDKLEKLDTIKNDKQPMSVYNDKNKLLTKSIIRQILAKYNVCLPKNNNCCLAIFNEAMTHRSYVVRKKLSTVDKVKPKGIVKLQPRSNERLQLLGDTIVHLIIGEHLYHKYPKVDEGFLTRLRCKLENRESLYALAKKCGISEYLLVSQNIEVLHGRCNVNIIGGGFESFIGAVYLEMGMNIVQNFILEILRLELDLNSIAENETNYKDLILQLYNKNHWGHPVYKLIAEEGPHHCKTFTMGIYLEDCLMGSGSASSKKKAEQKASKKMYLAFCS